MFHRNIRIVEKGRIEWITCLKGKLVECQSSKSTVIPEAVFEEPITPVFHQPNHTTVCMVLMKSNSLSHR
jgi:hypothetical protein